MTGGNGAPFALGDMKYDNLFDTESAATTALAAAAGGSGDIDYVGYLEDASSDSFAGGAGDEKLFAVERVAGERYGNIITYGVKLIDGELGESVTFDSLTFNVKWENDAGGADYDFWGQFKPAEHAPALGANPGGTKGIEPSDIL